MTVAPTLSPLARLACDVARAAGALLRERGGVRVGVERMEGKDIKTRADRDAEELILNRLSAESPYRALAEERGGAFDADGGEAGWIVDPLDGTLNHSRGLPLACVSIALWRGWEPVLGVVYDFNRDELFAGEVGVGAWCGERPITVSSTATSAQGVLCTGFPSGRAFDESSLLKFVRDVQQWKKVRLLGSAALSLAWVAAGRADAYAEDDIQLWDVAAGLALVRAAGGTWRNDPGSGGWKRNVRASNGRL